MGGEYTRVENIVKVSKVDGTFEIFIISHVCHIDNFEGVDHPKVAVDSGFEKVHSLSKLLCPCVCLELNGKLLLAKLCNHFGSF